MKEEVLYDIFLDLHKAYNDLDREICLKILDGYGVVPHDCRLIHTYWDRMNMVARAGGYYNTELRGFGARPRGTRYHRPFLMWWWTWWYANGYRYLQS